MTFLPYFLLWSTVVISGGIVFFYSGIKARTLKLLLAFSGAYLFALCVLHLIPEIYIGHPENIGIYILAGFFLQVGLDVFSGGIEHGHVHRQKQAAVPVALLTGLCVHSFLEGMPLVQRFSDDRVLNSLVAGIILHHIPVAIALTGMLMDSGVKKGSVFFYLLLFACMAPMGAATATLISGKAAAGFSGYLVKIMAVVIGIFLHISTTILFESSENHRFNYYKLIAILTGAGLALITL